ncbi:hypothetical protein ACJMK2_028369, partial [Sinanodonta woodiana]
MDRETADPTLLVTEKEEQISHVATGGLVEGPESHVATGGPAEGPESHVATGGPAEGPGSLAQAIAAAVNEDEEFHSLDSEEMEKK